MSQKPRKKPARKPGSKKLNLSSKNSWKKILKDVDKSEVPIHVLQKLLVSLTDGTKVEIDIKQILASGADPDEIEDHVNARLKELDNYIENVDFFVDLEQVEKTIQPVTDKILANL